MLFVLLINRNSKGSLSIHYVICPFSLITLPRSQSLLFPSLCSCSKSRCRSPKAPSQWLSVWPTTPSAAVCLNWTCTNKFIASSGEPCPSKYSHWLHQCMTVAHTQIHTAANRLYSDLKESSVYIRLLSVCVFITENAFSSFQPRCSDECFSLLLQGALPMPCVYTGA